MFEFIGSVLCLVLLSVIISVICGSVVGVHYNGRNDYNDSPFATMCIQAARFPGALLTLVFDVASFCICFLFSLIGYFVSQPFYGSLRVRNQAKEAEEISEKMRNNRDIISDIFRDGCADNGDVTAIFDLAICPNCNLKWIPKSERVVCPECGLGDEKETETDATEV